MKMRHGQEYGECLMETQNCDLNSHPPVQEGLHEDIADKVPLYNSRLTNNYVEYLRVYHPDIDIAPILNYADIKSYQLDDEGHWFTQKQVDRFHEILAEKTNSPDIAREVGRFAVTSRSSGALRQYLLGFISPVTAYAVIEKINARLVRSAVMKIKSTGADKVEAKATLMPNVVEKPYQCLNRLGSLEAVAKIFTGKFAKIEHPICLHKGGDCCLYNISWEKTRVYVWQLIRNCSYIVGFVGCVLSVSFMPPAYWDALVLSFLLTVIGTTVYTEYREKRELIDKIRNQGDAADRLIDQINLSYSNALLVQEIGQATSSILDIKQLLSFIVDALEKRLDFDRGMIMLANRERTRLVYTIGYGYNPEQQAYLKDIEFHLDNPKSRGAFVVSFRKQAPFLINDVGEIAKDFSPRSIEFVKRMGTRSFICAPIIFKGESLGILVVDNIRSKRLLSQSDMSLLMGIAPQIAISINNAISYRKIAESEKRFRSLSESAPDIIYTIDRQGVFTYVNPAWERILGHCVEDVLGRYFTDFLRPEDIPVYSYLFKGSPGEDHTVRDIIGTLLHKDGSDRFFSISGAPNLDSEGSVIGVVGTLKDVTDSVLAESKLKQSFDKLQNALGSTIQAISRIVESRDPYTSGHQERVSRLATAIAEEMRLSGEMIESIRMAAILHDVGKINIPAEILSKPKKLSEIEMGIVRMHPEVGYNILAPIEFPYPIARIVVQHHEKMDGSGYPAGLTGENILMEARILAVADVVEAMASHRPYRPAFDIEKALEEISHYRGTRYDEVVVSTCLKLFDERMFVF
jgi:PAS domain S-box-containing protein/putative nucleotidyltransferase with HDIG domain